MEILHIYYINWIIKFILLCARGPSAILIQDWLSSYMTVGALQLIPISGSNFLSQIASHAPWQCEMYSAYVDDKLTVDCFLNDQLTTLPKTLKTYPDVDFLSFLSPAQSASVKPINTSEDTSRLKTIFKLIVDCIYRKILLAYIKCSEV